MCIVSKTISACVYDDEKCLQSTSASPLHRTDGHLSGERPTGPDPVEIPTVTPSHPLSGGVFVDVSLSTKLDRMPSTSSDAAWVATNEPTVQDASGADQVLHGELVLARENLFQQCVPPDTSPSTFAVPSFLRTIPPELWMPLSFLGEGKLQVQISDEAATDLDMKWCVLE